RLARVDEDRAPRDEEARRIRIQRLALRRVVVRGVRRLPPVGPVVAHDPHELTLRRDLPRALDDEAPLPAKRSHALGPRVGEAIEVTGPDRVLAELRRLHRRTSLHAPGSASAASTILNRSPGTNGNSPRSRTRPAGTKRASHGRPQR